MFSRESLVTLAGVILRWKTYPVWVSVTVPGDDTVVTEQVPVTGRNRDHAMERTVRHVQRTLPAGWRAEISDIRGMVRWEP
jgi:hypothetical protein